MKSLLDRIDLFQIVGFLISAFVAFSLLFTGHSTLPSVTLGFVLAALTQLLNLQRRLRDLEDRLLEANALGQALYRDEWLLKHIQHIVNDYQSAKTKWFQLFKRRAEAAVIECYEVLHSLSEGHMTFGRRNPFSFGTEGIKFAKRHLKAITTTEGIYGSFWHSIHAEKYLQANREAIQRGVKFARVFINSRDSLRRDLDILKQHQSMGIDVYVAFLEDVPAELNESFIVMDDRLVARTELADTGRVKEWKMSIDPIEVEQMVRKFDVIMRCAKKLDDVIGRLEQSAG